MGTFTNRGETYFNRCGLIDLAGDDAGWAQGQDPGFGALPDYVPALPSTNSDYLSVNCDATSALTSALAKGQDRWRDAKANDGWTAALAGKFYHHSWSFVVFPRIVGGVYG